MAKTTKSGFIYTPSVEKWKTGRRNRPSVKVLMEGIFQGDRVALSQAITLLESERAQDVAAAQELVSACLPKAVSSVRVGITGVPGVGKSTFIEILGKFLRGLGKKVAVLAIDPTSSLSKGSILGDKTRMEGLAKDEGAFIRPSPTGASLGGVARKTREALILCEAAGFEVILIETVGVGQSEIAVHSMVDFFLLLALAGAGDELQGIKRGVMEVADAVVIHKADGDNIAAARRAKAEAARALHLYPPKENGWTPKVLTASSIENKGIREVWELIDGCILENRKSGFFEQRRRRQNGYWLLQTVEERLKRGFYEHPAVKKELEIWLQAVERNEVSPFLAAERLFAVYTL
jgi:LAO/AO transport system kinase